MCENNEFKYSNFCTTCLVRKPLRSKHCPACNHCVAKFDHHCPWVDNSIVVSNHHYSITFLTSGTIMLYILFYDGIMFFPLDSQAVRSRYARSYNFHSGLRPSLVFMACSISNDIRLYS